MLHDGDADLVAFLEHARREGLRHDVEGLGGVTVEDHVAGVFLAGADEARHALARGVDGLGRLDGELVQAAQRVGVHGLIEAVLRLDDAGGALRGCRAVEEREVGHGCEQREVLLVRVCHDVDRTHR